MVTLVGTRLQSSDETDTETAQLQSMIMLPKVPAGQAASLPMSWVVLAGQVASVDRSLLEHPAVHRGLQEHLGGPGACRHQACNVGVVLCFCGP